jgi:ssDNA-binding replication factor A large subunit
LRLRDDTGETTLVVWNQRVDELGEMQKGDCLRIMDARIKAQPDGRMELHAENSTQIETLVDHALTQSLIASEATSKVANLKEEGGPFNIEAAVASTPNVKEVTTAQNEQVLVASFDLADDTGNIRISLWRKHAELGKGLSVGTRIRVKNVYVKRGFSNLLELISRASTTIEIISKPEVVSA